MKRIYLPMLFIAAAIATLTATFNAQTGVNKENAKLAAEIAGVLRGYYDAFSRRDASAVEPYSGPP